MQVFCTHLKLTILAHLIEYFMFNKSMMLFQLVVPKTAKWLGHFHNKHFDALKKQLVLNSSTKNLAYKK